MHRFDEVMRSGAEPPLIQKRSRHAALVSSACFSEAGQPLRPMRQAAAVPFSWAEAPCRKHIYIGARSAVRPDWLRYYSDTGWLWIFLLAAHRATGTLCFPISGGRPTMAASDRPHQEQWRRTSAASVPASTAASRHERRALLGTACQEGNQEPMCASPA